MSGIPFAVRPAFDNEEERAVFLDALEESLRPLMRVVFRYGVTYQELMDSIRGLYISALRERLAAEGRRASVTRLGLTAGVSQGEITKLFESREARAQQRALTNKRIDQLSQLLSKWHDDSRFSTPYGAPLELSFRPAGTFRTFDELVAASSIEMSSKEALEHLDRANCIEIHGVEYVRCVSRTLISRDSEVARLTRMGRSVASLNATLVRNLLRGAGEDSLFERTTLSDFPISKDGQKQLLALLREEGADFINELDRWVSGKEPDFTDPKGAKCGVTLFFFEEQKDGPLSLGREASLSQVQ